MHSHGNGVQATCVFMVTITNEESDTTIIEILFELIIIWRVELNT